MTTKLSLAAAICLVLYGTSRLDNSAKFTQAILETSCPSPSRQTSAPSFQARVTHRQNFGTFVMACANRLSLATRVTSMLLRSSRKGQLSARARTMPPSSCTTSEPTRSWLSTHTTTSYAGSPRWPLASPADYSWLDTMTLTSTFGTHSGLNAPVYLLATTTESAVWMSPRTAWQCVPDLGTASSRSGIEEVKTTSKNPSYKIKIIILTTKPQSKLLKALEDKETERQQQRKWVSNFPQVLFLAFLGFAFPMFKISDQMSASPSKKSEKIRLAFIVFFYLCCSSLQVLHKLNLHGKKGQLLHLTKKNETFKNRKVKQLFSSTLGFILQKNLSMTLQEIFFKNFFSL